MHLGRASARLLTALALTMGGGALTVVAASPAHAEVMLTDIRVTMNSTDNVVAVATFEFDQNFAPGSTIHLSVSSCGQFVKDIHGSDPNGEYHSATIWFTEDGKPSMEPNPVNAKIGKSFQWIYTITEPGTEPYSLSGSFDNITVKRPTCEEILSGGNGGGGCTVKKWSSKVGTARVGNTVRVTKPRTSDCGRVSYVWTANGDRVKRGNDFRIPSKLKGDRLKAVVKVKGGGKKTLRFGTVR